MLVINFDGTVTVQLDLRTVRYVKDYAGAFMHDDSTKWCKQNFVAADQVRQDKIERGFLAEMAVAQYVNYDKKFSIVNPDRTDVDGIEVRSVDTMQKHLITHKYDKQAPYVLAVSDVETATVILRGWLPLEDCNIDAHWWAHAPRPAYFTPATVLHPMATLRDKYNQKKSDGKTWHST